LGSAAVASCGAASGGEQVNMGSSAGNGISFTHVAVPTAGTYRLSIAYMSAVARQCRLFVNGNEPDTLYVAASGPWCYQGGAPAEIEHLIRLESGVNVITFRPAGAEAPFIDKISVTPDISSMEAEDALLIGSATVAQCAAASGGEQVNLGASVNNGVRFDHVVTQTAGTYRLVIGYMSAVTRQCRLLVNGNDLGIISVDPSGAWCYQGGSPAEAEQTISLPSGINTITFRPVGTDTPFIDKISLLREVYSMEAEDADLFGGASIVQCASASGGEQVNLGSTPNNRVRFDEIEIQRAGAYRLSIAYMSAVTRQCKLIVNGIQQQTLTFEPSGAWCYEDGVPTTKSIDVTLQEGLNRVEFKPMDSSAPFLDKIAIVELGGDTSVGLLGSMPLPVPPGMAVRPKISLYPNPASAHAPLYITLPDHPGKRKVHLSILDMSGIPVFECTETLSDGKADIHPRLNPGLYYIIIR